MGRVRVYRRGPLAVEANYPMSVAWRQPRLIGSFFANFGFVVRRYPL